ncbi:VOC family protein [Deinococcus sp. VB343]|uniref:VOC family protein n=1 Tax=Deinococcus sp. VB142 TaxID=3112952 RepID=A0AAU6Q2P8_9DEIO
MTTSSVSALPALGPVTLLARDLPRLLDFYRDLLGLQVLSEGADGVLLGTAAAPLLRLRATDLPAPPTSRPGLYHTAFLLPTRAELGRWLAHAARLGLPLGSGDHLVSEAFYLSDPEGNGIEVYADRPREDWRWVNGQVQMDTLAVDTRGVLAAAGLTPEQLPAASLLPYQAPAGLTLGHVHLKVGNAAEAARFYQGALGLDLVASLPGARFLSWNGYHHHFGLNEWHSRGQGHPSPAAGLGSVEVVVPDLAPLRGRTGIEDLGDTLRLRDPWGNTVHLRSPGA